MTPKIFGKIRKLSDAPRVPGRHNAVSGENRLRGFHVLTKGGVFVADETTGRERREDTRYRAVKLPGEVLTNVTENTICDPISQTRGGSGKCEKRGEVKEN